LSGLLLDTHVWIWHLNDDPSLPKSISRTIDREAAHRWLSPLSVWELVLLAEKSRLHLEQSVDRWLAVALERCPVREAVLTFEVAERAKGLLDLGDPADTLIAATAMTYDLTLVTMDKRLRRVKGLKTLSR
jgi:PIN domain nuclease of toxin-antitoxin system